MRPSQSEEPRATDRFWENRIPHAYAGYRPDKRPLARLMNSKGQKRL